MQHTFLYLTCSDVVFLHLITLNKMQRMMNIKDWWYISEKSTAWDWFSLIMRRMYIVKLLEQQIDLSQMAWSLNSLLLYEDEFHFIECYVYHKVSCIDSPISRTPHNCYTVLVFYSEKQCPFSWLDGKSFMIDLTGNSKKKGKNYFVFTSTSSDCNLFYYIFQLYTKTYRVQWNISDTIHGHHCYII